MFSTATKLLQVLLTVNAAVACSAKYQAEEPAIAIANVSVIDVESGQVKSGQTVVVRSDRIEYAGNAPPDELIAAATVHDHTGHYVVPGLWDMHVHFRNSFEAELAEENGTWLRQYPGFGVTAVRDAGGDLSNEVLAWKTAIENDERSGPRIFTSLQKLDGVESDYAWPGSIHLNTVADVAPAIDKLESMGADFVKLYDGSIDGEIYLAALAEAERRSMKTAGHMPLTVSFEDAITTGLDSVEHEVYLVKAASADEAQIANEVAQMIEADEQWSFFDTLARLQAAPDQRKLERVFDLMIKHGAALTPTLHIGSVLDSMTDASVYQDDPQLAEVPPGIRESFEFRVAGLVERSAETVERDLSVSAANREIVRRAAEYGVTILAGSDTGAVNSFLYPGDSLHRELEALVSAGLTPLQALQAATLHAVDWLQQSDDFGSIETGKVADLVVLENNPLADIRNTRSIVAVLQSDRYLDSEALAALQALPQE